MGKVYTTQEFTMYVNTGINLANASTVYIKGTDPSESSVSFTATVDNSSRGILRYDVLDTEMTTAGVWTLWAYVDFNGGDAAWGEPFHLNIYSSGS